MFRYEETNARLLTVKDVAHYLKVSISKVYRMANANQIPAFRIGTSWRFKQDMIDTWIQRVSHLPREE
jgi:excisionase family DNA binding protein